MMTKKQFCECIIRTWENQQNRRRMATEEDCKQSSQLAVAMEYLGLLKDEKIKGYAADSNGVLYLGYYDKTTETIPELTMRDMLSLLPE